MRYSDGWTNDPTWSQHKRTKPTFSDLEDDMQVDSMNDSLEVRSTEATRHYLRRNGDQD